MKNIEGRQVPNVVFKTRANGEFVDRSSAEIFNNRTVVLFALPGAFTPTCSSTHVPRYNQLAGALKAQGVDEIICLSVNDAFVMNEWQSEQGASEISFLPDGNGDFTRGMGMLVQKSDLGFGERSWRYSMLVRDGVIEKMFIEPDQPGDPFGVSDADTMLAHLAPEAARPLDVTLFTRNGCPHCLRAKALLRESGIAFDELVLNRDYQEVTLRAVAGQSMVPQVYINGEHIGGADELERHLSPEEMDAA